MIKIEIKTLFGGNVIFDNEQVDNTIKDTVIEAVKHGVSLQGADLRYADLQGVDLTGVNLSFAYLHSANLQGAKLIDADLTHTILTSANLSNAKLCGANLHCTDFGNAKLCGADLLCTEIDKAFLRNADISAVASMPNIPAICPTHGSFIGWKKIDNCLIKLLIPEDAKRCYNTARKCCCNKATVLKISNLYSKEPITKVADDKCPSMVYEEGKDVYSDDFDKNGSYECTYGISFSIDKMEAVVGH